MVLGTEVMTLGEDTVRAFFDSGSYLDRNAVIPVRARIVQELLPTVQRCRVLDLGCGDGSISRPLLGSGNELTLVDFSPKMLDRARAAIPVSAAVAFVHADVRDYVPSGDFDVVLCVGLLAHVDSVDGVIARVSQALRPGGHAVLQITDDATPLGWLLNRYYRRRQRSNYRLTRTRMCDLMAAARRHELMPLQTRRYGLLLPGLGRLPYRWEAGLELALAQRPRLKRLGAELLMSCSKSATNSSAI
jgi:2-polyprenyl-3-methyl-5-hydroxy-6-metoxy-1,4-benzoquinol methylase